MRRSIFFLIALGACAPTERQAPDLDLSRLPQGSSDALAEDGEAQVWFTDPGTERGEEIDPVLDDALIALIDASTTTLDLALYDFDRSNIADAVLRAWDRGVDVRMVSDADEADASGHAALEAAGIPVTDRRAGDHIMHNKFVVVDGQAVWTGSTNLTETGILKNDNDAVLLPDRDLAAWYTAEFEQMAAGRFGRSKLAGSGPFTLDLAGSEVVTHLSPQHDPLQAVVELIDSADHSVRFLVFSFTHADVIAALVAAHDRGVDVVGIFDESQAASGYSADEALAAAGIPVYIDGNHNQVGFAGGKLHHKTLIIDGGVDGSDPVVATGSFNWSQSATHDNDENLVEIHDVALTRVYGARFCDLLARADLHPDATAPQDDPCSSLPRVFINELYPDPPGMDRGQEFVEIVNGGTGAVDLSGWTLGDAQVADRHVFDDLVLAPGEAVVIFDSGKHPEVPGARVASSGALDLGNRGDSIRLVNAAGEVADALSYRGAPLGRSLNRQSDLSQSSALVPHDTVLNAWTRSSPGKRADGLPFDPSTPLDYRLVINEVMADPSGEDTGQEYFELVNLGPDPADLRGVGLSDLVSERHRFGRVVLPPGAALVVYDRGDHSDVPGAMQSSTGTLGLNNSGDTLVLVDADGLLLDSVSWGSARAGVAFNRAIDGDPDSALVLHDAVVSGVVASPGLQANGQPW